MLNRKLIRNFYKSRFVDSLEKDFDKWEMRRCCASTGDSWIEWHGPEYKNKRGERIQFAITLNYTGAYVNGTIQYTIGAWEWFFKSRRLRKAFKNMKSHVRAKMKTQFNERLMKAL